MALNVDPRIPEGLGADVWKRPVSDCPHRAPSTHVAQPNRHGADRPSRTSSPKDVSCKNRRASWKDMLAARERRDLATEVSTAFFRRDAISGENGSVHDRASLMTLSVLGRNVAPPRFHVARCDQPIFAGSLRSIFTSAAELAPQPRADVDLPRIQQMAKAA